MESTMKEVESDLKVIRADVHAMRSEVSHVKGKLEALPTTIQLGAFALAIIAASGLLQFLHH